MHVIFLLLTSCAIGLGFRCIPTLRVCLALDTSGVPRSRTEGYIRLLPDFSGPPIYGSGNGALSRGVWLGGYGKWHRVCAGQGRAGQTGYIRVYLPMYLMVPEKNNEKTKIQPIHSEDWSGLDTSLVISRAVRLPVQVGRQILQAENITGSAVHDSRACKGRASCMFSPGRIDLALAGAFGFPESRSMGLRQA
jgi:hypothetical protein